MKKISAFLASVLGAVLCLGCTVHDDSGKGDVPPSDPWAITFAPLHSGEEKSLAAKGSCRYEFSGDLGDNNYLNLKITASVPVRGEICYAYARKGEISESSKTHTEPFYLLPCQNEEMRYIVDFYGEHEGRKVIRYVDFYNLTDSAGSVTLSALSAAKHPIDFSTVSFINKDVEPQMQLFVQGETIKLGCTLKSGGAVNWFSSLDTSVRQIHADGNVYVGKAQKEGDVVQSGDVNLINSHDNGRLVQQSYYGIGPDNDQGYVPGQFGTDDTNTRPWHSNPVQGGD